MRRLLPLAVAVTYLLSLALPAVFIDKPLIDLGSGSGKHAETMYGIQCLLVGFFVFPGWLANPLMLAASLFHTFCKRTVAITLMVLALISTAIAPFLIAQEFHGQMRAGYVVWALSQVLMLALAIDGRASDRHVTADGSNS